MGRRERDIRRTLDRVVEARRQLLRAASDADGADAGLHRAVLAALDAADDATTQGRDALRAKGATP